MTLPGTPLRGFPEGVRSDQGSLTDLSCLDILSLHGFDYVFIVDEPLSTAEPQFPHK